MKIKNDSALAHELPYWEFFEDPIPHTILVDGSLASGLKVSMLDIECFDDAEVNQLTLGLRAALDSISESTSVQFVVGVGSDFTELLTKHKTDNSVSAHDLIKEIAHHRAQTITSAIDNKELYKPELQVYIRTEPVGVKKAPFWKRKTDFSKLAQDSYEETLEVLSESMDTFASAFESLGLRCSRMSSTELTDQVYQMLNRKRSDNNPVPKLIVAKDAELDATILEEAEWLANQSPREQLVFGDLVLNLVLSGLVRQVEGVI